MKKQSSVATLLINEHLSYIIKDGIITQQKLIFPKHNKKHVKEIQNFKNSLELLIELVSGMKELNDKLYVKLFNYLDETIHICAFIIAIYKEHELTKIWNVSKKNTFISVYNHFDVKNGESLINNIKKSKINDDIKTKLISGMKKFIISLQKRSPIDEN